MLSTDIIEIFLITQVSVYAHSTLVSVIVMPRLTSWDGNKSGP